ncbi:hypothetical protein [Pseudonocardia sp. GCM10023141]|uniref:hypothetical protein n=1 Tax=Pseudonocardia sp. GCM10023141 TaxID=3252653 RepID=UPI00360C391A
MTAPPLVRHVEHVMGLPISVALCGRHAGDGRGRAAWAATLAVLRDADRIVSTRTLDPTAAPWRIGIEDPHDPSRLADLLWAPQRPRVWRPVNCLPLSVNTSAGTP